MCYSCEKILVPRMFPNNFSSLYKNHKKENARKQLVHLRQFIGEHVRLLVFDQPNTTPLCQKVDLK